MKLEIYDETKEPEQTVRLKLVRRDVDTVDLVAVDETGEVFGRGHILTIYPDGTFHRCMYCEVPGIKTNDEGEILERITL